MNYYGVGDFSNKFRPHSSSLVAFQMFEITGNKKKYIFCFGNIQKLVFPLSGTEFHVHQFSSFSFRSLSVLWLFRIDCTFTSGALVVL